MPRAERIWTRADAMVGLAAAFVAGSVYFWTAAPNVTLLDSGEFVVAAQHFGVPHPTGYPLWTLLAWLFQLLPIGNAAWEINLFSGFCGALATGLVAVLFSSSTRWMLGDRADYWRGLNAVVSLTVALLFAFSESMWSQAVIAEVYTLHALLIGLYLTSLYVWLRRPESLALLLLPFFLLALSFSNHQLSVALAPLPFLAVLLVRRGVFWDLVVAGAMTVLVVYLGFAILSGEAPVLKTAIRFFYCVMAGFLLLMVVRRFQVEWRLVAYLPFVVALGLLPYAYMPLASSTNPPMNWAYTRTPEGFFFSFNRSQYGGSLSQQSLRSLGKLMGTSPVSTNEDGALPTGMLPPAKSLVAKLQEWVGFFWFQLGRSFTPLGVLAYFAALLVVLRIQSVAARTWIYVLEIAFVLAAILQPVADGAQTDVGGWWLQMPYHTYTNFIFALLAGLGFMVGALWLCAKAPRLAWWRFGMLALPLWPLFFNHDTCNQRGRWFGWDFGYDMLKDLPRGSVVTRLIWEKNRDAHEFFVEESFPLEWSYDHAEPHGLVYRINREPLKEIPLDLVRKDFEFWDAYVIKLKGNPEYAKDLDALRSFSKLRASTGNLYRHRKMDAEAERVYRQALELWPGNGESLNALNGILWDRSEFDGVLTMLQPALDADPNSIALWQMYLIAEKRKELQGAIVIGEEAVAKETASSAAVQKLLELYASVGDTNKVAALLGNSIPLLAKDAAFLKVAVEYGEAGGLPESELAAATALVALEPDIAENQLALARAALRNNKRPEFFSAVRLAMEMAGLPMREVLAKSQEFDSVRNEPEFQAILGH